MPPWLSAANDSIDGFSDDEWLAGALDASDFPRPAPGELGTLPRNSYYGPGYFSTDLSLFKNIRFNAFGTGTQTVQLRIEAYNVFNTLNLANPNGNIANTNFGRVTAQANYSRTMQVTARFSF